MNFKDYYKILEVSPSATETDIKKSYRRLALKYHPDKNFGNQLYEAKFKEIQEAYQVLSNIKHRQHYNTQRNYYSEQPKAKTYSQTTPQAILNQVIEFRKKVAALDPDRMNKLALFKRIEHILVKHNIVILQQSNDARLNKRIIEEILFCSRYLSYPQIDKICYQLTSLAGTDNTTYRLIYNFLKSAKRKSYLNRYKMLIVVLFAIIICIGIYLASQTI